MDLSRVQTIYLHSHVAELDVLRGQPIKFAQVASTSESLENQQNFMTHKISIFIKDLT